MATHDPRPEIAEESSSFDERSPAHRAQEPTSTSTQEPTSTPAQEPTSTPAPAATEAESSTDQVLFAGSDLSGLRSRWTAVQSAFVDDPRICVQQADGLVADVVETLTTGFGEVRARLEQQWDRGEEVSTEDLRLALTRYREFFDRLIAI